MNRKDFFKKLGIGAFAVVVAPKILADKLPTKPQKPEGRRIVDNFVDAHKNISGKHFVFHVTNKQLRDIENGGFEFIKDEYWPLPITHTCERCFYYRGMYIYLCVK